MIQGVTFGIKHSYEDFGLILSSKEIGLPTPKTESVSVIGRNGDLDSCQVLTGRLEDELHYTAMAPYSGTIYDLKEAAFISCPEGVVIRKQETKPQSKSSSVYQRLVAAGQRLLTVIRHNEGGANKDLAKLTSQINNLCDKWDR